MSAPVVKVTREELLSERRELLKRLGISLEQLKERAATYSLSPEEWAAWDQIEEIAFLLGED